MISNQLSELHQRNKLIVWLLWGCILLGVGSSLQFPQSAIIILSSGVPLATLCTLLVWKRMATPYIMYISAIGFNISSFFFIYATNSILNLLILFLGLGIISLYHNYRPLLVNGILSVVILNYVFITKPIYDDQDLISVNAFLILMLLALVAQSQIGSRMLQLLSKSNLESEQTQAEMEKVMVGVTESIRVLTQSASVMQDNASITDRISKEVVMAFQEIATGVESQTQSITDISNTMEQLNVSVAQANDASITMSDKSLDTDQITKEGQEKVTLLTSDMSQVMDIVLRTSDMMTQMNEENQKIEMIVSTIVGIAEQTNLLSLNASIEAARAGEHGKGFAVVSTEIRKLAQNSHTASADISDILSKVQRNIQQMNDMVIRGLHVVETGKNSTNEIALLFDGIRNNTQQVLEQAQDLQHRNEHIYQSSSFVLGEVNSVASITEESTAAIEQVLASAEIQQQHVSETVDGISHLNTLAVTLDNLTKRS
ncbi:methyl-accepting chemotaxis protein [Paenibacillus sp. CMAA1364]